jgi:hypothetical protein
MAKNHIGFNRRVFNLKSRVPNLIFKTKIGEVNNQFQGNIPQQDEDLGEAEIVED